MRVIKVYARFYKSFNFDRIRKARSGGKPRGEWEMFREQWFPYVEVEIDKQLTTVVGANESGKSHLLSAIEKAITGTGFKQRDLCRYSPFFGVTAEQSCWPHLGLAWSDIEDEEAAQLSELLSLDNTSITEMLMFREGPDLVTVWLRDGDDWKPYPLQGENEKKFSSILPRSYRIYSDIALPDSIPFSALAPEYDLQSPAMSKKSRNEALGAMESLAGFTGVDQSSIANNAAGIYPLLSKIKNASADQVPEKQSIDLARDLLLNIAKVDPEKINELALAIAAGDDGFASALIQHINENLERSLNLQKWWVQDRDFSLRVAAREYDLVFTISDRTGTEYTFKERSSGLKYFLSYLIQAQAHRPVESKERILLMDEPDTYLSAEAQQDLMRVLRSLSEVSPERPPVQVIYVTHSPFLIDKNYADRIRVLEKGRGLDGTKVVSNASQNHYEPLRSAFGSYVGETAFVGAVNLLVEGVTDQIALAGASRAIRRLEQTSDNDALDLNAVTIVPCGSASHVPYMIFLIRGRDADKPAVIALLDADQAGSDAVKAIKRKPISRICPSDQVIQIDAIDLEDSNFVEIEDLIPAKLAEYAVNYCLTEVELFRSGKKVVVTDDQIEAAKNNGEGSSLFPAIEEVLTAAGAKIEKLAFARTIAQIVESPPLEIQPHVGAYLDRMKSLFQKLNRLKRKAEREASQERLGHAINREQEIFVRDNPDATTKENLNELLEKIEDSLDGSPESDAIRSRIMKLRREYKVDEDPADLIVDYPTLKNELSNLKDSFELETEAA